MNAQEETFESVIDYVQSHLTEDQFAITKLDNEAIDKRYRETVTQILTAVTAFPVRRAALGNALSREEIMESSQVMEEIVHLIAVTYAKTHPEVENDIKLVMTDFPLEELREATYLRTKNRLH